MAQITAGTELVYGTGTGTSGDTAPTTWHAIPDITTTPALGSDPKGIDVTTLAETTMKVYIEGLMDLGGALKFDGWYTPALIAAAAAANAVDPTKLWFGLIFPEPVEEIVRWKGTIATPLPGDAKVDAALPTIVYITPTTEFETATYAVS
jgi:hypothetical protein